MNNIQAPSLATQWDAPSPTGHCICRLVTLVEAFDGLGTAGHPESETTRLATEIAGAITQVAGVPADRLLVVFQISPAHYPVEGGRVLPEPGQEEAWIAGD